MKIQSKENLSWKILENSVS